MNRATVLILIIAALGIGGYLYWDGTRTPGALHETTDVEHAAVVTGEDHAATADPALTPEGFDKEKVLAAIDASDLDDAERTRLKAMLENGGDNEALRDAALEQIRAALGQ